MTNYDTIYEYAADNYGLITSSEAKTLGIPNVELVKLAHRGRLQRLGYGVYRIEHYIPTINDKYAEAITLIGNGAAIYGESVLAMHGLALVNPNAIYVAVRNRLRKTIPPFIKVIHPDKPINVVEYEGIPAQSVFEAIIACKSVVMTDRLIGAVVEAERQGLISSVKAKNARKELL
jgi:predicted transcriptional regulator of viral defense system